MENFEYCYKAKVIEVYDADTVTLDVDLGIWTRTIEKCRLLGVNAPEIRGEERPQGLIARDALRELILDKDVVVKTYKDRSGKYGRLLADIHINKIHVNQWLIDNGYAVYY